jgi:hypothetical protein
MKREYQHKGIKIVTETKQALQAWKCDARVFLTARGGFAQEVAFAQKVGDLHKKENSRFSPISVH